MKPKAATDPQAMPCFECDSGTLLHVTLDHTTRHPKLGEITIPGVPMLRCDRCGDTVIGHEGSARIDAFLSVALNSISPAEIQQFLDKYNLSQKQASAITGLGEKNISRWLNGHSRSSESVSNYLRVLLSENHALEFHLRLVVLIGNRPPLHESLLARRQRSHSRVHPVSHHQRLV